MVIVIAVAKLILGKGTLVFLFAAGDPVNRQTQKRSYSTAILVGMDFLVAGDLIKSVVLELTLSAISALGLLVLVRTFLAWSIIVESEGRWPWESPDRN